MVPASSQSLPHYGDLRFCAELHKTIRLSFPARLEGGLVAIDGQGKFLFVLNPSSNDISMFQMDQASGAVSEVTGSHSP